MSATMTASTAVLGLLLLTLLFASLVCSAMAVRYYNHAGFISGRPVDSKARQRWAPAGPVAAVLGVVVLSGFDRFGAR